MLEPTTIGPLTVSNLALGAMLFGTTIPESLSRRLLDRYVDARGTFIDTANNYAFWPEGGHAGSSEELIGRWLKDRGRRDDLVIATKVGALPNRVGAELDEIEGLGREAILASVENSLRRLGTDYIDLYYAHIDDRTTPLEETLETFDMLVRSGKVRAIGCSNNAVWRIERAIQASRQNGWAEYVALQQHHSYFRPRPESDFKIHGQMKLRGGYGTEGGVGGQHLDYIRFNPKFRVVAYTPMLRGAYANPERLEPGYRTDDNDKRRAALDTIIRETGSTASQVVLAWLLHSTPPIIPLAAVSSEAQLDENLAGALLHLSPEQMRRLDSAA